METRVDKNGFAQLEPHAEASYKAKMSQQIKEATEAKAEEKFNEKLTSRMHKLRSEMRKEGY